MINPRSALSHPFDSFARDYDRSFTHHQLGEWLRSAVHTELERVFKPGQHVLELGCGTGEDALWLAQRGIHVTATDASQEMLAVGQSKIREAGLSARVQFHNWDFAEPLSLGPAIQLEGPGPTFDGVFSNFGGLNCIPDRQALARALHPWLRPQAKIILILMGPICPWEITWFLLHGQFKKAFRRFKSGTRAHVGAEHYVQTWYPSPARIRKELGDRYQIQKSAGIGFFLPPSYLHHLVDRHPRFFARVNRFENQCRTRASWAWLGDHYLMVFQRKSITDA